MVTHPLLDYINQARAAGQTGEQIRQALTQAGWPQTDIQVALTNNAPPSTLPTTTPSVNQQRAPQQSEPRKKLNASGALVWGVLGFVIGLIPATIVAVIAESGTAFIPTALAFAVGFGIIGARRPSKQPSASEVISDEGLTKNEKIAAWSFGIINPVLVGLIMYSMWKKRYPNKAKEANKISFIIFFAETALAILISIFLAATGQ